MPRKTRKYVAGLATAKIAKIRIGKRDHESVYEALEDNNFFWQPRKGIWEHREHAPSTSIFEADDKTATGIVKIRIMAHPDDLENALKAIKSATGLKVIEISEKSYKNRKGTGERLYTTAILDEVKS